MFKITITDYGIAQMVSGTVSVEEIRSWQRLNAKAISTFLKSSSKKNFQAYVDLTQLDPLSDDVIGVVIESQAMASNMGLERCAIILNGTICRSFMKATRQASMYEGTRFFNSAILPNYEELALEWLIRGKCPDTGKIFKI